jgi:hypothetical protein
MLLALVVHDLVHKTDQNHLSHNSVRWPFGQGLEVRMVVTREVKKSKSQQSQN